MKNRTEQLSIENTEPYGNACVFTGHRELSPSFKESALKKEVKNLIKQGVTTFYNGGAMGFDLIAAECVLALKKKNPNVKLIVCVPCSNQDKKFSADDKKRYAKILQDCDEKILLAEHYFRGCMQVRNRYMVDRAAHMIAHFYKDTGGTAFTVNYFKKIRKKDPVFV